MSNALGGPGYPGDPDDSAEYRVFDLSRQSIREFPVERVLSAPGVTGLDVSHNQISILPPAVKHLDMLVSLDISNNGLCHACEELAALKSLQVFVAKNNALDDDSLPKSFATLTALRVLNLGGNNLTEFPPWLTDMPGLRQLYLGDNKIQELPRTINQLASLEVLSLGGNRLSEVPAELGSLGQLSCLNLAHNRLQSLPAALRGLRSLRSLSLHGNRLQTLPPEIVVLNLEELSLRGNPLVVRFVEQMSFEPPRLLELAGRAVKGAELSYSPGDLPGSLQRFLDSAKRCVNPKCKGVYFDAHVENVKFVDFCGKFRVPLLQYLCSPGCTPATPQRYASSSDTDTDDEFVEARRRLRRVLLG